MWDPGGQRKTGPTGRFSRCKGQRKGLWPLRIAAGLPQSCCWVVPFPRKTFLSCARLCLTQELGGNSIHLCQPMCPFPDSHVFLPLPVWRKPPNRFLKIRLEQPHVVSPRLLNGLDVKLCSICSKKDVTDRGCMRIRQGIYSSFGLGLQEVPGKARGSWHP